jgi:hypothetical protein
LLFFFPTGALGQTTIGDVDPTTDNPILSQPHGTNIISCSAYNNITYSGHTIEQINATEGDYEQLWGQPDSITNPSPWSKNYSYGTNSLSYNTTDNYTQGMKILNNQWPIKVLGKEIRVGNSFSEFQQKFGSNLNIIYKPAINPSYVVSFNCSENEYDGLLIYFSPATHKVQKIRYFVNP